MNDKDSMQELLQEKLVEIDARAELAKQNETGMEWLPNWYTRYEGEILDSIDRLALAYQKAKRQLEAEQKALKFRWGHDLRLEIDKQFEDGKGKGKKSIRNLYGKVGYRKISSRLSVIIDDPDLAVKQAEEICPQAIKKSLSKTVLKQLFVDDGLELEGTHIEESAEYQKFYIAPEQKLLTQGE